MVYRALAVLTVSCSCALVISVPVAVVAAISRAARDGILVKGGAYVEALARVRVVAFDKTGTLTLGRPVLTDVVPFDGRTTDDVLSLAAAVEAASEHPLAAAFVDAARERGLSVPDATDLRATPGVGVEATVEGRQLFVGRLPEGASGAAVQQLVPLEEAGKTAVVLAAGDDVVGVLAVADELRPDAAAVIDRLHRLGTGSVVMLTGDNERTAAAIAARCGVDDWRARLLPEDRPPRCKPSRPSTDRSQWSATE